MSASPTGARLLDVLAATWPAAETVSRDGWLLNRGADGGKRVSAAVRVGPMPADAEIDGAEAAMRAWGQRPLFRLAPGEEELDARLAARGFDLIDPVVIYLGPVPALGDERDETARIIRCELAVAAMREIWAAGGIGPGRLAVMSRAPEPRRMLMARRDDRPAGAGFLGCLGGVAMLHAVEVAEAFRRRGVGREILRGAANLAADLGASWLSLAVTEANLPARALYESLGMAVAARYHYRIAAGGTT